jgi:short-subunit dehydrogenase
MSLADAPHVLVTGTSGAIGSAIARELRARRPRARLSLVDVGHAASEALARELGGDARAHGCDLARLDALPDLLADAEGAYGPVDGLVNCAGFMEIRQLGSMPWELGERLLRVDLLAPLRLQQACVGAMVERGAGFVVNVASMAGRVPIKGCTYYGAAKAGLAMASEIARAELAPRGVHVVTVYPGPVHSALERGARAQVGRSLLARGIPTGNPDELARRILDAVERRRARVVYPDVYQLGFRALGLASRITLGIGPEPVA